MRLTENEIEFISRKIVKTLVAEGKLEVDNQSRVVTGIRQVIVDDLRVEDQLNEEVEFFADPQEIRGDIVQLISEEMRADEAIDALARRKIESQKRTIVEGSDEWDVLYRKYYEEETAKHRKLMP